MQTNTQSQAASASKADIGKLQEFLRGELSAVETYELALQNVTDVGLHAALQEILAGHVLRTIQLRNEIRRLGSEPTTSSGVWGAFAKVFQAGADLFGNRAAVAALEEGEDHGLRLYSENLGCEPATRAFVEQVLLPQQQRTHELCRTLKVYLDLPS